MDSANKIYSRLLSRRTAKVREPGKIFFSPLPANEQRDTRPLKKFLRPRLVARLLGICVFGCLTGFLFFDSPYWMAGIWTALGTAVLFMETVRYVDQSERKLCSFLQALNQNDFSVTFFENKRSGNYDLHHAFNQLNETFRTLRSDKESQHQLLQVIVETAAVPLICFEDSTGDIFLMNDAAGNLFNVPATRNIRSLWRVDAALPEILFSIKDGEKQTIRLLPGGKAVFLSLTSQHIIFKSRNLKLTSFHDVSSELAMKEADTWQKLLRVLTHEISNSAIPLSTLSSYICEMIDRAATESRNLTPDERQDVLTSLKTIEQRSRALKAFVQNFKSVNQIPDPQMQHLDLNELLSQVHSLFLKELSNENIEFKVHPGKVPQVYADTNLTMQVLINLFKNAIESMSNLRENKSITAQFEKFGKFVSLHIADTGCGIAPEDLEQIFIPFFSTKKTGSGIGLSISQQIMQKQKGDITVRSIPGEGSVFTLTFSCCGI